MEEFVRKDIEKTPNSFFYTPKRFISKAEAFSLKERDVFILSIRLNRAVVWAESCGRCGLIVRSFGLNRAVVWAESCGRFRRLYIQKRLKIIAVPEAYGIIFSRNSPESLFSRTDF